MIMTANILEMARKLPVEERVKLVEELWDSIVQDEEGNEIPAEHKNVLDQRLEDHLKNPDDTVSFTNLEADLDATFGPIK
jgi:putative addiction module component (TIGR02574 family)